MGKYTWQAKVGISLLLLFALISGLRTARTASIFKPFSIENDKITDFVDRFDGLKNELPPREVVGYLSYTSQSGLWGADYFLTQYALAPILVAKNGKHPLVVVDFHKENYNSNTTNDEGLTLIKDFGDGVVLFSSEEK